MRSFFLKNFDTCSCKEHEMADPRCSGAGFLLISPTCAAAGFQSKKPEKYCPKISRLTFRSFVFASGISF